MRRRLDELCEVDPGAPLRRGLDYPFIRMADVEAGRREPDLSLQKEFRGSGARFRGGDTLLARITPCLENGKIAQVPREVDVGFGSTEFMVLRAREGACDPDFLYYLARSDGVRLPAEKSMSGTSGRQRVNRAALGTVELNVPHVELQRSIARVLSGLDNLHAVNRRRIQLAEMICRHLFEEWFLRFRFPGVEDSRFIDSPIGPVPEDWDVVAAAELFAVNPSHKIDTRRLRPFVSMADVSESVMVCFPREARVTRSGAKYLNGDTLLARITPCLENGKTAFVRFLADGEVGAGSTEFIVLRGTRVSPEFVYLLARSDAFRNTAIKSMTGASGRQRVSTECFNSMLVAAPPPGLEKQFAVTVRPLFQLAYSLSDQNRTLITLREWLIPRLLSGDLPVGVGEMSR